MTSDPTRTEPFSSEETDAEVAAFFDAVEKMSRPMSEEVRALVRPRAPASNSTELRPGERVQHVRFGAGTVVDPNGPVCDVRFEDGGVKNVMSEHLSRDA